MTARPRWRRGAGVALAAAVALATTLPLAGCSDGSAAGDAGAPVVVQSSPSSGPFKGTVLQNGLPKPSVTLTDTSGQPYDMAARTEGRVAAVYVGYTNCPDVCPTTMADLAVAVRSLTPEQRADVDVVMVTSDPARDTPERMRQWLDAFDRSFVGLTGAYPDVQKAATEMGIPIEPPVTQPDGTVVVDHGAQVLLFGRTGPAKLIFTSGFTSTDVAHDMALLLEGTQP